jgi:hypothetical protein
MNTLASRLKEAFDAFTFSESLSLQQAKTVVEWYGHHRANAVEPAIVVAARERIREQGSWIPACNGTEVPFNARTGRRLLYCWQPSTGEHAYLDLDTDLILTDEEARQALGV